MYYASNHPELSLPLSIEATLTERVIAGDRRSFLYIVPTGAQARDLINRITMASNDRSLMLPYILSLGEFITKFRSVVRPELQLISAGQSAALIELSMRELFASDKLHYFEERSQSGPSLPVFQGTFDEIIIAINGLKEQGVAVEALAMLLERRGEENSEAHKLRDIYTIYSAYTDKIRDSLVDLYGQYFILIDKLQLPIGSNEHEKISTFAEYFHAAFPGVRDVYIAPFVRFTNPAFDLLEPLGRIEGLSVTFAIDGEATNPELFFFQNQLASRLEANGFLMQTTLTDSRSSSEAFRSHIRKSLFARRGISEPLDTNGFIEEHKAASLEEEVTYVARKLKVLLSSSDAPSVRRVAIASTDQALYAPTIRSIFREYGIPVQLTHRTSVDQLPIYHAFEYLLELGYYRLNRRRIRAVLESPYFRLRRPDGNELDRHSLLTVLVKYHFPQGSGNWSEEMQELITDLEDRTPISFEDNFERRNHDRELNELRCAKQDILVFEALITQLEGRRTPAEFVTLIRTLFNQLDVVGSLLADADGMRAAHVLEGQTRAYASLNSVLSELESLCQTLSLDEHKLDLGFYLERLRAAATHQRSAERAEPGSAVIATSFDQLFGNEYDHVFLLGLREGLFPRSYRRSLFTPSEHATSHDVFLREQRFEFYQTISTALQHLTLSWHTGTEKGNHAYRHSSALDALQRVVTIDQTEGLSQDPVLSNSEFYRHIAEDLIPLTDGSIDRMLKRATDGGFAITAYDRLATITPKIIASELLRRTSTDSLYSGNLSKELLNTEEQRRLETYRTRVFSITQLETYASCGFKYFCRYLLGLTKTNWDSEEGLESSERGTILHKSLFRLLERFKEKGMNIRTMGNEALVQAHEIINELYPPDELERMHPFRRLDQSQLFESSEGKPSLIQKFIEIEQESQLRDITTFPAYFELAFGQTGVPQRDDYPNADTPVEIGGIKIRGKIDRIDMDPSGNFVIVDYKTGSAAARIDIDRGFSLQLPLYLRIAEDLLRAHLGDEAIHGVGALYHSLKVNEKARNFRFALTEAMDNGTIERSDIKQKFKSDEELSDFIETIIKFAQGYVDGIANGRFPIVRADRRSKSCMYCEYQSVCRVAQVEADGLLIHS